MTAATMRKRMCTRQEEEVRERKQKSPGLHDEGEEEEEEGGERERGEEVKAGAPWQHAEAEAV